MTTTLLIRDFNGRSTVVEISQTPDEFNDMIDNAFASGNYLVRMGNGFVRYDVRNIASIIEIEPDGESDSPIQVEQPEEEPLEEPTEPDEPAGEEPAPAPEEEPVEEPDAPKEDEGAEA